MGKSSEKLKSFVFDLEGEFEEMRKSKERIFEKINREKKYTSLWERRGGREKVGEGRRVNSKRTKSALCLINSSKHNYYKSLLFVDKSKSTKLSPVKIKELNQRLFYKNENKNKFVGKYNTKDIIKNDKLTEFVILNKIKNKLFLKKENNKFLHEALIGIKM